MNTLTQSTFPGLYWLLQYLVGGTVDKRKLALLHYRGQKRVLEVGCSVGNVAVAFQNCDCKYVGVDIDPAAINYARKRFRRFTSMNFVCANLIEWAGDENGFDCILFAGVCHHIATPLLKVLLERAIDLLSPQGYVVVIDPVIPGHSTRLMKAYLQIDQGEFMRTQSELLETLGGISGLSIQEVDLYPVGATPLSWPIVAQFVVARMVLASRQGIDQRS